MPKYFFIFIPTSYRKQEIIGKFANTTTSSLDLNTTYLNLLIALHFPLIPLVS